MQKHQKLLIVISDSKHAHFVRRGQRNILYRDEELDSHAALAEAKFARFVARELNRAAARKEFDELVVVAPARTLNDIRGELDCTAAARIVGTLAKDLVKTPDQELWPHVWPCIAV